MTFVGRVTTNRFGAFWSRVQVGGQCPTGMPLRRRCKYGQLKAGEAIYRMNRRTGDLVRQCTQRVQGKQFLQKELAQANEAREAPGRIAMCQRTLARVHCAAPW
jgi:hypothetical protein